jgi:eukaryotic-like serine/threonine-protein kinase
LGILDQDLRLITPVDDGSSENTKARNYQLAHDYMVPSLREWLTRKQRETKKGRAELKLAERAAAWSANQEAKQLPTLLEWLQIRRLTEPAKWRPNEKAVMRASTRYHLQRVALGAAMIAVLTIAGLAFKQWNDARLMDREADNLVARIETADFSKLADELPKVATLQSIIAPKLQSAWDQFGPDSLWDSAEGSEAKTSLPIASALADYDPNNPRWSGIAGKVSNALVRENA